MPLLWIGLFREPRPLDDAEHPRLARSSNGADERAKISDLSSPGRASTMIAPSPQVQDYIAAGDVYQINLTLKYHFAFAGDPVALYAALRRKQRVAYGALIHAPTSSTCCRCRRSCSSAARASTCRRRPMKGTAPRGRTPREDARLKTWLAMDEKQRAENLMIVDLLRNDLGRVAKIGSVEVTDLFTVETYRSVHQMTSGISAELDRIWGSRTCSGRCSRAARSPARPRSAPWRSSGSSKAGPRGVYTGAIGHIAPSGDAQFNVGIRTVVLEPATGARWASAAASSSDFKGRRRVRGMPAEGAFPHQGRCARSS